MVHNGTLHHLTEYVHHVSDILALRGRDEAEK
jgi:hypothetical protein